MGRTTTTTREQRTLSYGNRYTSNSSCADRELYDAPDLPLIYRTVGKDREKRMVTRHLNGGGVARAEYTAYGASVSQVENISSFANAGVRRHNHTMHRFEFKNKRNLSTSFNTSTLTCTTCKGEPTVLRREIEGEDVGLDTTSVFILIDQNFPSMIPAGGGGEYLHEGNSN
jgi:hypothetical protein